MKKYFILIILILACFSCFAFSKKNENIVLEGVIVACGNDPFVSPEIKTVDGEQYPIFATKEQKNELLALQGKKILLTGKLNSSVENEKNSSYFLLKKYKVIQ